MNTQKTSNTSVTTGTTSIEVLRNIGYNRKALVITNTSVAAVVTVAKGEVIAVQGAGIRLNPNSAYIESTDSGFNCWQGPVQVVSDVAGTVAIVETFEEK